MGLLHVQSCFTLLCSLLLCAIFCRLSVALALSENLLILCVISGRDMSWVLFLTFCLPLICLHSRVKMLFSGITHVVFTAVNPSIVAALLGNECFVSLFNLWFFCFHSHSHWARISNPNYNDLHFKKMSCGFLLVKNS